MTQLLYQENSYIKESEAIIKEANGKFIVLDKSIFIPAAGGLPNDEGVIKKGDEEFKVIYAIKKYEDISLEVDKEGLNKNDRVHCKIDWNRRHKIMQYHTALHALSSILHKKANALVTGNRIDINGARVDFSLDNFDKEKMQGYIEETNKALAANQEVTFYYLKRDEALKKPELARLAKGLPESIEEIRIVKIGNIDEQADGGPQVRNTSEIPELEFIKAENKGKNNRRLYFRLKE